MEKKTRARKPAKPIKVDTGNPEGQRGNESVRPVFQDLQNNPGMQVYRSQEAESVAAMSRDNIRKILTKTNDLKDTASIVPVDSPSYTIGWPDAEKDAIAGKLVRCISWPPDTYLWYKGPYSKPVKDSAGFYYPCTKQWLDQQGVKSLVISGHWCLYSKGKITVGYRTKIVDRMSEWEIAKI